MADAPAPTPAPAPEPIAPADSRISRVYAHVNRSRPGAFWSFLWADIPVDTTDPSAYVRGLSLGRGSFSEVYAARRTSDNKPVAMKQLRYMSTARVLFEVHILKLLGGLCNTIALEAVHFDPRSDQYYLVFERMLDISYSERMYALRSTDVRFYMLELLRALDYCHSQGIMHRDVKPENILIDSNRKVLRLIDFGASDFYLPGRDQFAAVGTFAYMAPELTLQYQRYDYAVDMWSFGCVLAGMIYRRVPFFRASCRDQMLGTIAEVVGPNRILEFAAKYETAVPPPDVVAGEERKNWTSFVTPANQDLDSEMVRDLLDKVLVVDPYKRLTAAEAMEHPYFDQDNNCDVIYWV